MRVFRFGNILVTTAILSWAAAGSSQAALVISSKPTNNVSCSAGVCTATAKSAVMNATDLAGMLASSDVTLLSANKAKDIEVKAAFSWASSNRLTLDSYQSIAVEKLVTVAGSGALTLTTNDGGAGGTLSFTAPGRVAFWDLSSSLIVNGASYTLVGDIATLASDIAGNPAGDYALANNYDASADGTYAHSPVATTFSGGFEGLGNTISNLSIQDTALEDVGLFGALASSGSIENALLTHASVSGGKTKNAAALVATNAGSLFNDSVAGTVHQSGNGGASGLLAGTSSGTVSHCHSSGSVKRAGHDGSAGGLVGYITSIVEDSDSSAAVTTLYTNAIGGLVGQGSGTISNSHASGPVTGVSGFSGGLLGEGCCDAAMGIANSYATGPVSGGVAGGLAGILGSGGSVTGSHATGSASGSSEAGGLVGANYGTIDTSRAEGAVSLTSSGVNAGGLAASNLGTISRSFATGSVTGVSGSAFVGGLVGSNVETVTTKPLIENSYATGSATAGDFLGGIVGWNRHGFIHQTYEIGAVSNAPYVGGVIGYNQTDVGNDVDCYWDTTTSGAAKGVGHGQSSGVTGLTSAELQSGLPSGFDPSIWAESPSINGGFPYLIANPPP
jgi:hypothetical protein